MKLFGIFLYSLFAWWPILVIATDGLFWFWAGHSVLVNWNIDHVAFIVVWLFVWTGIGVLFIPPIVDEL